MRCFEFIVAMASMSKNGGPYVPENRLIYGIPEDAQDLLEPVLEPYGQNPAWYFDKLNFGRPPAPWAIACLDQEYSIGGHIAACRSPESGISFAPYTQVPNPIPEDFVPEVGVITIDCTEGLRTDSEKSPLLQKLWESLIDCAIDKRWLILLDPLPAEWLAQVVPGNRGRWFSNR